jgi:hypothetical protein
MPNRTGRSLYEEVAGLARLGATILPVNLGAWSDVPILVACRLFGTPLYGRLHVELGVRREGVGDDDFDALAGALV